MATTYVCDCCNKAVDGIAALRDEYALPNIGEVCQECLTALEEATKVFDAEQRKEKIQFTRDFLITRRSQET